MENKSFKVYLMVGIPGAGKSTWISHNLGNIPIVSRDIIRHELGFTKGADDKAVLTADGEKMVTQREHELIHQYAKNKQSFVIDDTNTGKFRTSMIDLLHRVGAYVIGVNLNTPLDVCIKRREGQIPSEVMKKIYANKINLNPNEVDEIINVNEENNMKTITEKDLNKIIYESINKYLNEDEIKNVPPILGNAFNKYQQDKKQYDNNEASKFIEEKGYNGMTFKLKYEDAVAIAQCGANYLLILSKATKKDYITKQILKYSEVELSKILSDLSDAANNIK